MNWEDVQGWLSSAEGAELQRLAAGNTVLEIGSLFGRSTVCMAETGATIVAVDPHDGFSLADSKWHNVDSLATLRANLAQHAVDNQVVVIAAPIQAIARHLTRSFDLAFVDGDHSHAACLRDCQIAERLVRPGGVIAVHDYRSGYADHAGVTSGVDAWRGDRRPRRVKSLAVFQL